MTATNGSAHEEKLADYLRWVTTDLVETRHRLAAAEAASGAPVAIIGMSCRYPGGSNTVERYWQNLLDDLDAVREVPADRWDAKEFYDEDRSAPGKAYTQHAGFVDDVAGWDANFFGLSPQEARRLDPQHRMLMELVWEGLEDAGLAPDRLRGSRTGVFVGLIDSQWLDRQADAEGGDLVNDPYVALGNAQGAAAGRIAYHFDLRGPTLTVDTACSSSLVATHLAVQALRRGECDVAVVAASSVIMHPNTFIAGCKMGMLAADGRSKAFDESGDGYGLGEGGGVVVLQRAPDVAGRRVHAVIRGSAVNQDGRSNGLTAPNKQAQVALLRTALANAGFGPDDLNFLEAHGTGTALGDAIEFSALLDVFGDRTAGNPLLIGAVKSNIGHLHAASGLAGLIKSVQAVKHGEVPGNQRMTSPISVVTLDGPVRPVQGRQPLPADGGHPRRAGVSSFGWSGTNAHVIIEQAPDEPVPDPDRDTEPVAASLLTLSAERPESLARAAAALADRLESTPELEPADVAYTLQTGRSALRYRRALWCTDVADAVARLRHAEIADVEPAPVTRPAVGMRFPAAAAPGVLDELYRTRQAFRAAVDECVAHGVELGPESGPNLRAFVLGHALAALARSMGVVPVAVYGEGAGEQVAEHLAGRYGLGEALRLVRARDAGEDLAEVLAVVEPTAPRIPVAATREELAGQVDLVVLAGPRPDGDQQVTALLEPDSTDGCAAALGRLWELGVAVDWAAGWPAPRRVADLPTYSFERTRFWPELVSGAVGARHVGAAPAADGDAPRAVRCHTPTWRRHDALPPSAPAEAGTLLVLAGGGLGVELAELACADGHQVLRAEPGGEYAHGPAGVTIDITDPEHYRRLLGDLAEQAGDRPVRVVHALSACAGAGADDVASALDAGFYSLLWLSQAIDAVLPDHPVELLAVTAEVFDVLGGDGRDPVAATVSALCQGIATEHANVRCRAVDLDGASTTSRAVALLREVELLAANAQTHGPDEQLVAWRRGRRWLRTFAEVDVRAGVEPERVWRPGGSYVITGGLSGTGLLLARLLAPLGTKLTLVTEQQAEDPPAVQELCAAGAEVLVLAADVSAAEDVERVIRTARERFGTLHGVVHAAEVAGGAPLRSRTRQQAAEVLAPKVHGTLAIADALRTDPPELLALCSSSVAVLGWAGEGDVGAANAFLDAFAACDAVTEKVAGRVVSIGWGPWQRDARQARAGSANVVRDEHLRHYREEFGITDAEGAGILPGIVATDLAQVVVLTQPFAEVADRVAALTTAEAELDAPPPGPKYPRPDLRTAYVAPRTETERRVAEVWQDYLGIERVGVHDPFFEIGGTSMIAIAVVNRLGKNFGLEITPASLFERPTAAELATLIAELDPDNDAVPSAAPPAEDRAARGSRRRGMAAAARTRTSRR